MQITKLEIVHTCNINMIFFNEVNNFFEQVLKIDTLCICNINEIDVFHKSINKKNHSYQQLRVKS